MPGRTGSATSSSGGTTSWPPPAASGRDERQHAEADVRRRRHLDRGAERDDVEGAAGAHGLGEQPHDEQARQDEREAHAGRPRHLPAQRQERLQLAQRTGRPRRSGHAMSER